MLIEELQKKLVDKIILETSPAFVILFGSFARGTTHDESDIDLAYFSDKQLSPYERFVLASELAAIANREVDLVDIKQIDTVFNMQIFEQGIPIYIHNENEFIRQKMRAYSMYATLSEQRAAIIDAIKERGSVFGNE
ncbi:hypothetical protein TCA2_4032 [Paenibacillus sp. TCA20]|uniref:Nucleotidyltransferase domain-containing protein n=1 Tax=Paenibacillus urinalis TaxID=521520 RepID=A0AAX3MZ93_9BACL|nr:MULTISPECIES: nucleotidyltransferase domain-containing protein [Paenibacillus]WDH82632.1 nucleotidyltransferase domain-containing protein [Paenibacillus urinalis]GAK41541.1 hypothetical protein TCA2_4032 [Paenibacillus sp. TCA20]